MRILKQEMVPINVTAATSISFYSACNQTTLIQRNRLSFAVISILYSTFFRYPVIVLMIYVCDTFFNNMLL